MRILRSAVLPYFWTALLLTASGCAGLKRENPYYNDLLTHHEKTGFRNPHIRETMKKRGLMRWLSHQLNAAADDYTPKTVRPDYKAIYRPDPAVIHITWIGHASALIQYGGVNLLTDPVFSDRASPLSFFGPKRKAPPGIALADLPDIDAVLISHNHYDHLDTSSVDALAKRKQRRPLRFYVPLGLKEWFTRRGIGDVQELDWWQTEKSLAKGGDDAPVCITAVPAQHFSRRGLFDGNKSLWSGWTAQIDGATVYFSGDTGYSPDFKEIGGRFRSIDAALIGAGAYAPRDILAHMHVTPEEAVQIGKDIRADNVFPVHWGTFHLTAEPMDEPMRRFRKAAEANDYNAAAAPEPVIGGTYRFTPRKAGRKCSLNR